MANIEKIIVGDTEFDIGGENNYSTEERVVGTWIDGKPIYQKTFYSTDDLVLTAGTSTTLNIGSVADLNIDAIIRIYGTYKLPTNGGFWALNMANANTSINMSMTTQVYNGFLSVVGYRSEGNRSYSDFRVTIQYTKTTD